MIPGDVVIKTENLSKKFLIGCSEKATLFGTIRKRLSGETPKREIWALKDINISINKGEMIGIVGPNGAGKTTLLRVLSGILKATSGKYEVAGEISSIFELGLGFNPRFTAIQNVYMYGALHGLSRKEVDTIMPEIVEYSGLNGFMCAKLSEFSSGMRQRLAFATIIQAINGVVLVDEVMAVGDQSFQKKCLQTYKKIMDEGNTIVFVSQGLDGDLKDLCSRVLYINKGEQKHFGDVVEGMLMYCEDEGI